MVPADSRDFGKAGKFAGLRVAEANGFADGSGKLRERSNGFDDKRSETSNARQARLEQILVAKRKGTNSWTNARVKAKARLGDREDAEDTVE